MPKSNKKNNKKKVYNEPIPTPEVAQAIIAAAEETGIDKGYLFAMARQESSFNPKIKAPKGTAAGLYQFIDTTWVDMVKKHGEKYGITINDKLDANASAMMAALYAKENELGLKDKLKIELNSTDLYLAHFLGLKGAIKFLEGRKKNSSGSARSLVSIDVISHNKTIFYDKDGKERSAEQVYALFEQKIGKKASEYNSQLSAGNTEFVRDNLSKAEDKASNAQQIDPKLADVAERLDKLRDSYRASKPAIITNQDDNNTDDTDTNDEDEINPDNSLDELVDDLQELQVPEEEIDKILDKITEPEEIAAARTSIRHTLQAYRQEYERREIQGYSQACDFMTTLGRQIGCPAVMQIGQVGKQVLAGYQAIQQLSQVNWAGIISGVGIGAATGGIALLGSAVLGLIGAFLGGGPDPTQIILDAINGLHEQIHSLREEMHEEFYQNAKQQAKIFRHITKSFEQLTIQLNESTTSIKLDLHYNFAKLEASLKYLTNLHLESDKETLLIKLTEYSDSVQSWKSGRAAGDIAKEVPKLSNRLHSWVKSHSHNPFLNGSLLWRTWLRQKLDPQVLNGTCINFSEAISVDIPSLTFDANAFMGFLGEYARCKRSIYLENKGMKSPKRFLEKAALLPNPIVMAKALENYILLKYSQPLFDNDPSNLDIHEAEENINNALNSLDQLKSDEYFWRALLNDYHEALNNIDTIINEYIKYEGNKLISAKNQSYLQHENEVHSHYGLEKQAEIPMFDILISNPDILINEFMARRLNYLADDISTLDQVPGQYSGCAYEGFKGSHTNKKRIYQNFKAGNNNGFAALLAEEYLGLISLHVVQNAGIQGLRWNDHFRVPADMVPLPPPFPREARQPAYPNDGAGVGRGSKSYTTNVNLALSLRDPQWQLPFDIQINVDQRAVSVVTLTFSESWQTAPAAQAICWTDDKEFEQHNGQYYAKYGTPGGSCMPFFYANAAKVVQGRFNSDADSVTCQKNLNLDAAGISKVKQRIFNHLLAKKIEIAKTLEIGTRNDEGQMFINQFNAALLSLDKSVYFLRWFAVLVGKDIEDSQLDNLLTSTEIKAQLKEYQQAKHTDLSLPITTAKASVDKPAIELPDLIDLPDIKTRDLLPDHPKAILRRALMQLALFRRWKKLFNDEFPDMKNSTLEEHELKCQLARETIFQDETFALLNELKEQSYSDARFVAEFHRRYANKFEAQEFGRIFDVICLWGTKRACSPSSIGLISDISYSLDSTKTQQWLVTASKRQWYGNIGFLMNFACQRIGLDFNKNLPANLVMWGDGLITLLKLIYNDQLIDAAEKAGYTTEGYLTAVQDYLKIGVGLKSIVYTIGTSLRLYKEIFQAYINQLTNVTKWLQAIIDRSPDQATAYRQFILDTGNYSKHKLDELVAYGQLLKSYISLMMKLDGIKDPEIDTLLDFMDRGSFIDYLREDDDYSYDKVSLIKRIEIHKEKVIRLQVVVHDRIIIAKDIFDFWYYLQNYFKTKIKISYLKLTNQQLKYLVIRENNDTKIDLINQFLEIHGFVDAIELQEQDIDEIHLMLLFNLLNKNKQIKKLIFNSCRLTADVLQSFSEKMKDLIYLKQIYFLKPEISLKQFEESCSKARKDLLILKEIIDQKQFDTASKVSPYGLSLQLPIGNYALHRLLNLGTQAQNALSRRLLIERSGQHLEDVDRTSAQIEADSLKQLHQLKQQVIDEANKIESTSNLLHDPNERSSEASSHKKRFDSAKITKSLTTSGKHLFFSDSSKRTDLSATPKTSESIITLGDGNCAFNAISLGLCDLVLNNQLTINPGVNTLLAKMKSALLLPDNNLSAFENWLKINSTQRKRQKLIAPILRELAIKYIKDNDETYAESYQQALLASYQNYLASINHLDDTFIVHDHIANKFRARCSEAELIEWWDKEGKGKYFDNLNQSAKNAGDRERYGSEIEIDVLASLLGITIFWKKDNQPPKPLGVCGGIVDDLTHEQITLLSELEIGEKYQGKLRLYQLTREQFRVRLSALNKGLIDRVNETLNEAKSQRSRRFNAGSFSHDEISQLKLRHIIQHDNTNKHYLFVGNNNEVDEVNIIKRMNGAPDLLTTVLDNVQHPIRGFTLEHSGAHWQYVNQTATQTAAVIKI